MHKIKKKCKICSSPIVLREAWNKNVFAPLFLKVYSDSRLYKTFNDLESVLEIQKYIILAAAITCFTSPPPGHYYVFLMFQCFPPKWPVVLCLHQNSMCFDVEVTCILWLQILKPRTFAERIVNVLFIAVYS